MKSNEFHMKVSKHYKRIMGQQCSPLGTTEMLQDGFDGQVAPVQRGELG